MKRLAMCLALLLLTKPALAAVKIIVVPEADNKVAINYATTNGEKVRAFAMDVTVAKGTIQAVSDFHVGESTAAHPGYGIFPGSFGRYITVDATTGEVSDWSANLYTPVADAADPCALGGLKTNGVTLEMGALYFPATDNSLNAPLSSGTLCKLTISEQTTVTVTRNLIRASAVKDGKVVGGIVLTDGSVVDPNLAEATGVSTLVGTGKVGATQ
jgi:hypothetical protein